MYIRFDHLIYICQDFYYLTSILANINNLLISNFFYLADTLTNIIDMLKIHLCYPVNLQTNTNNKVNDFIREKLVMSN